MSRMATFTTARRVEFGDTDLAGIAHFSNFFRWMEAAETDYLRARGLSVSWQDDGVKYGFPRVSATCDYLKPARFGDLLDVEVAVAEVGRKSVAYSFTFRRETDVLAQGRITSVYCRANGDRLESLEIPPALKTQIASER